MSYLNEYGKIVWHKNEYMDWFEFVPISKLTGKGKIWLK